jgi:hypothetical protein
MPGLHILCGAMPVPARWLQVLCGSARSLAFIDLRSGGDRKYYEQIYEIECRDVIEGVLNANSRTHQAQDTVRVT